jgi:hypothetical protein
MAEMNTQKRKEAVADPFLLDRRKCRTERNQEGMADSGYLIPSHSKLEPKGGIVRNNPRSLEGT